MTFTFHRACSLLVPSSSEIFDCFYYFFFNDTATTEIYTLSLHDALPIYGTANGRLHFHAVHFMRTLPTGSVDPNFGQRYLRSEERFSRNAETDLVCRLLLEKKKKTIRVYDERIEQDDSRVRRRSIRADRC